MKNCTGKCFSKFVSVCVSVGFEGVKGIVLFPIRKCPALTQTMTEYWATEHDGDEEDNHLKHWWQQNWILWLCFLSVLYYLEVRIYFIYFFLWFVSQCPFSVPSTGKPEAMFWLVLNCCDNDGINVNVNRPIFSWFHCFCNASRDSIFFFQITLSRVCLAIGLAIGKKN